MKNKIQLDKKARNKYKSDQIERIEKKRKRKYILNQIETGRSGCLELGWNRLIYREKNGENLILLRLFVIKKCTNSPKVSFMGEKECLSMSLRPIISSKC
jgi:hypothetical protein